MDPRTLAGMSRKPVFKWIGRVHPKYLAASGSTSCHSTSPTAPAATTTTVSSSSAAMTTADHYGSEQHPQRRQQRRHDTLHQHPHPTHQHYTHGTSESARRLGRFHSDPGMLHGGSSSSFGTRAQLQHQYEHQYQQHRHQPQGQPPRRPQAAQTANVRRRQRRCVPHAGRTHHTSTGIIQRPETGQS